MERKLPEELIKNIADIKGFNQQAFEAAHYHPQIITSVRFNEKKYEHFQHSSVTKHPQFSLDKKVPWCEYGFYLDERPQFTFDPLLHAGAYYVQEASSMFLWTALQQLFKRDADIKILDLCAAPGGKSTLLASYFKNALIVSNEVIKTRANILYENITKWGSENVVVTNNDAADFQRLENYFDLIVIDAPCSGSGLFRKDEDAIDEWSENNVKLCSQRQQRIIADIYSSLKHDGILIYSTCSYSQEEDEDIADWMKAMFKVESLKFKVDDNWHIDETLSELHQCYGYRFWPHKLKGEGFFICAMQKNETETFTKYGQQSLLKTTNKEAALMQQYVTANDWLFFKQADFFRAVHKQWGSDVALLQKKLYLKKAGINIGEIKGNGLIPHHEFALSTIFNDNIFKIELDEEQALQYLRKKDVVLESTRKGWSLCTYKNFSLGWVKILHNRVNNYYPTEWRIRKE
ncbi:methyltransferase RsmF C-terminal domain-like protein [Parafilimonas terrae]|uniref:16S rRNA C967 or C1407 C5-methylase, RsmB/RsmF family n=1 Tax=Parafilimonas terrae TaxID=1465490 RepID=A0A1I5TUD3_9BACT|nr:methyltransferase domain-containing protein [Parafilimonas terrae]SFP86685.1 16S rRNA C967 or C1407 C5-methylase, RsmB/RsmF family [Parafilimonas terrae]